MARAESRQPGARYRGSTWLQRRGARPDRLFARALHDGTARRAAAGPADMGGTRAGGRGLQGLREGRRVAARALKYDSKKE